MAVLSGAERLAVFGTVASDLSNTRTSIALVKDELKAAVNAIDDWVEANQTSFNNAIPQPARSSLTTKQKAQLLMYVVRRRYEVS